VDVGVARQVTAEIRDTGVGKRDHPLLALLQCAEHADVGRRTDDVEAGFATGSRFGFSTGSSDRNGNLQSDPEGVGIPFGPLTTGAELSGRRLEIRDACRRQDGVVAHPRCDVHRREVWRCDRQPHAFGKQIADPTVGDVRGNGDLQPPSDDGGPAQGRGGIAVRPRIGGHHEPDTQPCRIGRDGVKRVPLG